MSPADGFTEVAEFAARLQNASNRLSQVLFRGERVEATILRTFSAELCDIAMEAEALAEEQLAPESP